MVDELVDEFTDNFVAGVDRFLDRRIEGDCLIDLVLVVLNGIEVGEPKA